MSSEWDLLWRLAVVRRDAVRGLTTAAGVWVTAPVGIAAGAGLRVLAMTGLALELGELDGVLAVSGDDVTGASD